MQPSLIDLNAKIKKTLEMSLDVILLFKTSIDTRFDDLASNVDYL